MLFQTFITIFDAIDTDFQTIKIAIDVSTKKTYLFFKIFVANQTFEKDVTFEIKFLIVTFGTGAVVEI